MINLFLCILSSLYLCFGLLYFCCRILPSKHKISLPLFLCLSVFMALLFWIKRESQHNGITIVFQLTTFLVTLFLFQASFMKKLAVYFIFQLLIICPEILCTSVFIALHNLFIPTDTYTPHNLISSCSPAEYFVIELSNILLGLFLLWKISEILRQCIDYLKILTFLQLLLPLIAPVFLNVIISLQKKPEAVLALSIIYWIICIGSYLLFLRAVRSLAQQHREYLQKKMEIKLMKKQINDSVQLSNEYASLRKWNHDIENHIMSVMYLMDMKNMRKQKHIPLLFCPGLIADHKKNNQRRIAVMRKNIKLIPLFLFLFVFQLLYFLSTIYTEKIDHMFLILAVFMVLICILLYCVLSDVLKKSNTEMELAFLQKQKQLKQEQDYSLQIRRQDTRDFQIKTVQGLQDFQSLLEQEKYEQADTAIRNLNQTFQKERFHPYCQNNLLQAILEGKRLRAEQKHIQVSYEILLPEKISINTTDLSSIFFNLLDNAIEACSASGNPDPEIRLSANISNGFLTVYMHNTKNPMQTFTHKTTKSEPGAHGYGLSIIEDICQKYNGSYQWIDHNNTFDSIVLLQIKNL